MAICSVTPVIGAGAVLSAAGVCYCCSPRPPPTDPEAPKPQARQCDTVICSGWTFAAATQGASGQCQSSRKTISLADTNAHIH